MRLLRSIVFPALLALAALLSSSASSSTSVQQCDNSSSSSSSSLTGGSAARLRGLHVALHAQVAPASGFVVGSVMTTMGLRAALLRLPAVASVEVFFPFDYGTESGRAATMFDRQWDLVIIEGWFPSINSFIHEIRRISEPSWGHAAAVAAWGDDDEGEKRNNNYDAHGNLVDEAGEATRRPASTGVRPEGEWQVSTRRAACVCACVCA